MIQQLRTSLRQPIVLVALLAAAGVGFGASSVVHGVSYHTGTAYSAETQIGATAGGTGYAVPLTVPWLAVDGAWHYGGDRPACLPPTFVDIAQLRFATVHVTVEGTRWDQVIWVDCSHSTAP